MREYVRALIEPAKSLNSAAATSRDAGGMRSALLSRAVGVAGGGAAVAADAAGGGVDAAGREAPYPLESTRLVVRRTESVRGGGTIGTDGGVAGLFVAVAVPRAEPAAAGADPRGGPALGAADFCTSSGSGFGLGVVACVTAGAGGGGGLGVCTAGATDVVVGEPDVVGAPCPTLVGEPPERTPRTTAATTRPAASTPIHQRFCVRAAGSALGDSRETTTGREAGCFATGSGATVSGSRAGVGVAACSAGCTAVAAGDTCTTHTARFPRHVHATSANPGPTAVT